MVLTLSIQKRARFYMNFVLRYEDNFRRHEDWFWTKSAALEAKNNMEVYRKDYKIIGVYELIKID